ncbi:MAG: xylosidase, partial [Verrucomicrobiae bacterium]|nr:xylosidase [Verrucomicrobiae bacterium]
AGMLYVAMFDELDEGTAIYKTRNDPPLGPSRFLAEPDLPSDHYLWLTGEIRKLINTPRQSARGFKPHILPHRKTR